MIIIINNNIIISVNGRLSLLEMEYFVFLINRNTQSNLKFYRDDDDVLEITYLVYC